jgi:hypothetical protein
MSEKEKPITGAMTVALCAVAVVWIGGAVFNFSEQARFALISGFSLPYLLPLLLDGLSIALASVATAASMDGRAAIVPRLGTLIAVGASSWVSGHAAYARAFVRVDEMSLETRFDSTRVIIGVGVPLFSLLALEVLLVEIRRVVQKIRGRKSPVPIPMPRLVMWVTQPPWRTYGMWRTSALEQCTRELEIVQTRAVEATITQVTQVDQVDPPRRTRPAIVRSVPLENGDRLQSAIRVLRETGDRGVTAFRESARREGISGDNMTLKDLYLQAREECAS